MIPVAQTDGADLAGVAQGLQHLEGALRPEDRLHVRLGAGIVDEDDVDRSEYLTAVVVTPAHIVGAIVVPALGMGTHLGGDGQAGARLRVQGSQAGSEVLLGLAGAVHR